MVSWMNPLSAQRRIEELEHEIEKLRQENERLERDKRRLEEEKDRLRKERDQLKQELELARRASKRQAAPFSKGEPKANPKPPGRKKGKAYGTKAHRPVPDHVNEDIEVPGPSSSPCCGSSIDNVHIEDQYQTEIVRKTHVTRFRIHVGNCSKCGKRVQGRDSRQTSDAVGAAASQVGPEALSLAAMLNKQLGIPLGKTTTVLAQAFGLSLTPGGLSQALTRMAARCEPTYQNLITQVRSATSVTMDESGWRVGGRLWWLWAAVSDDTTVYGILPGRGYEQAVQLLGEDFDAFLIHDGWSIYYQFVHAYHQSCNRHLINRCDLLLENAKRGAAAFPREVKAILLKGLDLRDRYADRQLSEHGLASLTGKLEAELLGLLERDYRNNANRKLANHLRHEFPYLFTYLKCPGLEATNWRGEQAIRPAVVARKVWGGNRTPDGAHAQEILTSVFRTSRQRDCDALNELSALLRAPKPFVIDFQSIRC
jgi:transposase